MNAFDLLDETYTTVRVRFLNFDEDSTSARRSPGLYSYKIPRTWDVKTLLGQALSMIGNPAPEVIAEPPPFHNDGHLDGARTAQ